MKEEGGPGVIEGCGGGCKWCFLRYICTVNNDREVAACRPHRRLCMPLLEGISDWPGKNTGRSRMVGWFSLTIGALVERIHLRGERLVVSFKMIPNYVHNWVNLKVTVT